ncbi:hypothetical protein Asppvi_005437 [Aspergillus pseudoviridinutans]|uniref:Uncharacterized protein n=1 Tax=Aspergillus pseudoviridinutans TaxID=1517512 RepID=A0A9P3BCB2_9EURO|nr:hypothetical protein Asppvi_005437 [Aspergillus pseudoviridinutans]
MVFSRALLVAVVQADMAVRDVIVGHHYMEDGSSVADAFQQKINAVDAPFKDAYALVVSYLRTFKISSALLQQYALMFASLMRSRLSMSEVPQLPVAPRTAYLAMAEAVLCNVIHGVPYVS